MRFLRQRILLGLHLEYDDSSLAGTTHRIRACAVHERATAAAEQRGEIVEVAVSRARLHPGITIQNAGFEGNELLIEIWRTAELGHERA